MSLTDSLLVDGNIPALRMANADGKEWVMPVGGMAAAMELYQPGSLKGRWLKRLLPTLAKIPGVTQMMPMRRVKVDLAPELREYIATSLGGGKWQWSLFGGTPSVHRKATIQIFRGDEILGYLKVTSSDAVARLFSHEQAVLDALASTAVAGMIPRCISRGDAGEWHCFLQSTSKTLSSRQLHSWTPLHEDFIDRLAASTRRRLKFEDTDYFRTLDCARPFIARFESHRRKVVSAVMERVMAGNAGRTVEYGACHCDFTPWNMIETDGRLFVFDWEYASLSYPPGLDRWHYLIQTALFEQRLPAERILEKMASHCREESLQLYLLEVICRFAAREEGRFSGDMERAADTWCKLLEKCL